MPVTKYTVALYPKTGSFAPGVLHADTMRECADILRWRADVWADYGDPGGDALVFLGDFKFRDLPETDQAIAMFTVGPRGGIRRERI